MAWDISQFHFIRPVLLLLMPAVLLLWFMAKRSIAKSGWENYLPSATIRALQINEHARSYWLQWYLLVAALVLCLAAAGPTWIKQPVPTVQNQRALVVLLDLSPSMLAQDLKPDRLTRAKFKLIDILRQYKDGQVALIAYAGDAHTVSPLTDDPETLQALLPALHPTIMPSRGSNIESAAALARQLLSDANLGSGDVLLITDGVAESAFKTVRKELGQSIALSILGVGSSEAAPIPQSKGGFLRGRDGEIILSQINESELRRLASQLKGRYARLNNSEQDIDFLIGDDFQSDLASEQAADNNSFDAWADMGHWLLLLVLPLALWCFRRGFIYCLPLIFLVPVERSWAEETDLPDAKPESVKGFSWSHLWQTPDQRAKALLEQENYADAANTFEREDWRAIANYKRGDFKTAAQQLSELTDATNLYNKGNALAMSGDLESALKAYEQVLEVEADHADAKHNKAVVEQLMQQQQKQQEKQQGDQQQNQEQDSSEQQSDQSQSSDDQQSSEQNGSEQTSEDDSSEPQRDKEPQPGQEPEPEEEQSKDGETEDQKAKDESEQGEDEQENEQAAEQQEQGDEAVSEERAAQVSAEPSPEPLEDASEQWLRGIKDDPSGLLRRKFKYQAEQNRRSASQSNSSEERY